MSIKPARRQFVQTASAAIATAAFPILGANDRIQVGLVGLGGRGTDHIKFYSCLRIRLPDRRRLRRESVGRERALTNIKRDKEVSPKEFSDMRQVFADPKIDAVSIATPNHWHALATIWACQAGKDVYVRKAG